MEQSNMERLEIEAMVTEREGMIAENKQREHCGKAMAYVMDDFIAVQQELYGLLRKYS